MLLLLSLLTVLTPLFSSWCGVGPRGVMLPGIYCWPSLCCWCAKQEGCLHYGIDCRKRVQERSPLCTGRFAHSCVHHSREAKSVGATCNFPPGGCSTHTVLLLLLTVRKENRGLCASSVQSFIFPPSAKMMMFIWSGRGEEMWDGYTHCAHAKKSASEGLEILLFLCTASEVLNILVIC